MIYILTSKMLQDSKTGWKWKYKKSGELDTVEQSDRKKSKKDGA